jgi:AcrR family transcriptional regulator
MPRHGCDAGLERFNERMVGEKAPAPPVRTMRSDARRSERALVWAATKAIHREGLHVPLGTIAADAGVGIGTLYRHFPTRGHLMTHLTHRSFEQVLANAREAQRLGTTPTDTLRRFVAAGISQRNDLVLPLHGGPPITSPATVAVRGEVHGLLQAVLDRGRADHSLKDDLTPRDVFVFGAMLAQPHPPDNTWDATCLRLLANYLDGLAPRRW